MSVPGSRMRSLRSQPPMTRLAVQPIRSRGPPDRAASASALASVTSARMPSTSGRARLRTAWPSRVGRQPVRSRLNSSAPREFSIRRSWVVSEGWLTPSLRAARCRLPVSAMAHSALRCLTSSSIPRE